MEVPFNSIKEGLNSIIEFFKTILDYLNPFSEKFFLKNFFSFIEGALSYINPSDENFLGKKIIELFSDLLKFLFVPENNPFEDLKSKFDEKFVFVNQLKDLVFKFFGFNKVENGDYSLATTDDYDFPGFYITYYGYTFSIIDFSIFSQYRSFLHSIIISVLWVSYLWKLYRRSPEIVAGFKAQGKV